MHLAVVQPLYRARISRECTRIFDEGTIRRCMGRRYWPARTALCAFYTVKGITFLNSSCPYLLDNMHLALTSMEIRVHSRLILARYKVCSNARWILLRSYGHEEFRNVNPFPVQKAHKAVRAGQYLRPMQRRTVPSMVVRVHSRLFLPRYKGCTNARCICSRSYWHEEFKNVTPFSVQKAHKYVRAGQYLYPMQRHILPSMEIRVHS